MNIYMNIYKHIYMNTGEYKNLDTGTLEESNPCVKIRNLYMSKKRF